MASDLLKIFGFFLSEKAVFNKHLAAQYLLKIKIPRLKDAPDSVKWKPWTKDYEAEGMWGRFQVAWSSDQVY